MASALRNKERIGKRVVTEPMALLHILLECGSCSRMKWNKARFFEFTFAYQKMRRVTVEEYVIHGQTDRFPDT